MTVRPLLPSDIPILRKAHARSGFEYEFPDLESPLMVSAMVLAGDDGNPTIALAAESILQGYLFVCEPLPPVETIAAMKWLERETIPLLKAKGYSEMSFFLPPEIFKSFGSRLKRSFGFVESWRSLCKHF